MFGPTFTPGANPTLIPFGVYLTINPIAADNYPYMATIDHPATLLSWAQMVVVVTTNNGANFWTVKLEQFTQAPSTTTVIGVFTTALFTVGNWTKFRVPFSNLGPPNPVTDSLLIHVTPTGAPGNIYVAGPALFALAPYG